MRPYCVLRGSFHSSWRVVAPMNNSFENTFPRRSRRHTKTKPSDKDASPMRPYCVLRGSFHSSWRVVAPMNNSLSLCHLASGFLQIKKRLASSLIRDETQPLRGTTLLDRQQTILSPLAWCVSHVFRERRTRYPTIPGTLLTGSSRRQLLRGSLWLRLSLSPVHRSAQKGTSTGCNRRGLTAGDPLSLATSSSLLASSTPLARV